MAHFGSPMDLRSNPRPVFARPPGAVDHVESSIAARTSRRGAGGGHRGDNLIGCVDSHALSRSTGGAAVRNQSGWLGSLRGDMNPKGFCPPGVRPRSPSRKLTASRSAGEFQMPPEPQPSAFAVRELNAENQPKEPALSCYIPPARSTLPPSRQKVEAAETIQAAWRSARSHDVEYGEGLDAEAALAVGEQNNYGSEPAVLLDFSEDFQADPKAQDPTSRSHNVVYGTRGGLNAAEALYVGEENNYNAKPAVAMDFSSDFTTAPPEPEPEQPPQFSYEGMGWKGASGGWDQEPQEDRYAGYRSWHRFPVGYGYRHSWTPYYRGYYAGYGFGMGSLPPNTSRLDTSWELAARRYEQQAAFVEMLEAAQ